MSKKRSYLLSLVIFLAAFNVAAQDAPKIIVQQPLGEAKALIVIEVPTDSSITRFTLLDRKKNYSARAEVPTNRVVSFVVNLSEDKNEFKLFGYQNEDAVYSSDTPIVFNRAGDEITTVAANNSEDPKKTPVKKLGLSSRMRGGNLADIYVAPDGVTLFEKPEEIDKGKYIIEIQNGDKIYSTKEKIVLADGTVKPQSPQTISVKLSEGQNTITVYPEIDGKTKKDLAVVTKLECVNCTGDNDDVDANANRRSQNFRALAGLQQVGASSANSEAHPYVNFFLRAPLGNGFGTRKKQFAVWGDVSLTPTAIQNIADLSNISSSLVDPKFKANNLVDSFEFKLGLEQEIVSENNLFSSIFQGRSALSLIFSAGATLPLSSDRTTVYYKIPRVNNGADIDPRFLTLFPQAAGKTNVAFVTPDRDRFFCQFSGGLRLKTFFYKKDETPLDVFPAMFDLTVGQNEAVTGKPQGVVMRLDGSTPFPIRGADFLYLFGGVQMKLGKNINRQIPPFFLESAAAGTSLTNADTLVVPVDQSPFLKSNRDTFRIGVGVDLFKVFTKQTP